MGGLAVKEIIGVEGLRFSHDLRNEFKSLISLVFSREKIRNDQYYFITEYQAKDSFGDIDILIDSEHPFASYEDTLKSTFTDAGFVYQGKFTNGKIVSIAVSGYQLDFISTPFKELLPAFVYYANNDLGNLIGRIAHGIGLLYGHQGLKLKVRDKDDHVIEDVLLSVNTKDIMRFLGFSDKDVEMFIQNTHIGFPTLESMYEFVSRSDYFDGSKYDLDQLNQINRIRNIKRTTYMGFIKWLDCHPEIKAKRPIYPPYKEYYQIKAVKQFNIESQYFEVMFKLREKEWIAKKFNGDLIKERYGLEGIPLGEFIKDFYSNHPKEKIKNMTIPEIEKEADKLWEIHSKKV